MIICSAQKISKSYGANQIFKEISFEINEGERIGIVGRNGIGKTTIFKVISKIEEADEGQIHYKKGLEIGYLEQLPSYENDIIVENVLRQAFEYALSLEMKMKKLEKEMAVEKNNNNKLEEMLNEYGVISEQFARLGGYEIEAELSKVVNGLEISSLLNKDFRSLSGGEQTKVNLGRILLMKPDLMLLDEPTNHLDITALEWLEQYLVQYQGSVVVVSHDRYFLDNTVNKIFDMDTGQIEVYHSNYSDFVKEKERRLLAEFAAYQDQQKKIKKMKDAIKRLRVWANRANPPNEGLHRRASSMEKALERIELIDRPNVDPNKININFEVNERSGKDVILLENIEKTFSGIQLLNNVHLNIKFQDRIALIGKNGTGKSTLIKLILNELQPDAGNVKVGSNVRIGYLAQNLMGEYDDFTILEAFLDVKPVSEGEARNILAKFLFYGNTVFRKVQNLSGGEKTRLKLAQLMYQDLNLLLLDEPTNHLDIDSREELEEALKQYNGTILCVSHDRYFLNKHFQTTYWLENGQLEKYEGNYSYAKKKRDEQAIELSVKETSKKPEKTKVDVVKKEKEIKPKVEDIENSIIELEQEISEIENLMIEEGSLEVLQELQSRKEEKENQRDTHYQQLNEIYEEHEND